MDSRFDVVEAQVVGDDKMTSELMWLGLAALVLAGVAMAMSPGISLPAINRRWLSSLQRVPRRQLASSPLDGAASVVF